MYFPYLRGKQYELLAIRELASRIASGTALLPIIEPVKQNATTRVSFDAFVEAGLRFIFVTNPAVGSLVRNGVTGLVEESFSEYENYIPAFLVSSASTTAHVTTFLRQYEDVGVGVAFIYVNEPRAAVVRQLRNEPRCLYHIFVEGRTSGATQGEFPENRTVILNDPFPKADRNADYPDADFFSDRNIRFGNHAGFADYSIVGNEYSESGGPAYAVALHHVHYLAGGGAPLHIRHYVSDSTQTPVDPAGKFGEALVKLVRDLPGLGQMNPLNITPTSREYAQIHASGAYRGLGFAKKLAIKHHMELFLR